MIPFFTLLLVVLAGAGIFDEFTLPPAYWSIQLAVTAVVAGTLVLVYGPRTLRHRDA